MSSDFAAVGGYSSMVWRFQSSTESDMPLPPEPHIRDGPQVHALEQRVQRSNNDSPASGEMPRSADNVGPMTRPRLQVAALDCPDPLTLAAFYSELTGLAVEPLGDFPEENVTWIELVTEHGPTLAFQKVANHVAPTWPEGPIPQQAHLDFAVDDLEDGEAFVLGIGARKADVQPDPTSFRVFLDPAGHPFCLVRAST